jgi:hypothetical protein
MRAQVEVEGDLWVTVETLRGGRMRPPVARARLP